MKEMTILGNDEIPELLYHMRWIREPDDWLVVVVRVVYHPVGLTLLIKEG